MKTARRQSRGMAIFVEIAHHSWHFSGQDILANFGDEQIRNYSCLRAVSANLVISANDMDITSEHVYDLARYFEPNWDIMPRIT